MPKTVFSLTFAALCCLFWLPAPAQLVGGLEWSDQPLPDSREGRAIASSSQALVVVGTEGLILRSNDGENWQLVNSPFTEDFRVVTYADGQFVAGGDAEEILVSSDQGLSWQIRQLPPPFGSVSYLHSIVYFNGAWFLANANNRLLRSDDLTIFEELAPPLSTGIGSGSLRSLVATESLLASWHMLVLPLPPVAHLHILRLGTDGVDWEIGNNPNWFYGIRAEGNRLLISGSLEYMTHIPSIAVSENGLNWEQFNDPELMYLFRVIGATPSSYLVRSNEFGSGDLSADTMWLYHSNDLQHWQVAFMTDGSPLDTARWQGGWVVVTLRSIVRGQMPPTQPVPLGAAWAWLMLVLLLLVMTFFWRQKGIGR